MSALLPTDTSFKTFAVLGSILLGVYLIGLAIYRVYLSPVAHVPGPLLAKATYWYEAYYDLWLLGQYTFKIQELHEKYGPIIRINPHEVHISDPEFYDEVFAGAHKKRNKWGWEVDSFAVPDSVFSVIGHNLHRTRRAPLNPYFSKAKVRQLQPRIDMVIDKMVGRFEEHQREKKPLRLDFVYTCLANDVAMEYGFGYSMNRMEEPDFDLPYQRANIGVPPAGIAMRHFPILRNMFTRWLPDRIVITLSPDVGAFLSMQNGIMKYASDLQASFRDGSIKKKPASILRGVLESDAPDSEKSHGVLWQNGQNIILAGTLTTAATLTVLCFHLLSQPNQLRKLREELCKAIQDPDESISLAVVEQLPYLSAVIHEGLRISNGITTRLPRVDPEKATTFVDKMKQKGKAYSLPPGTPMSMTAMHIHLNPKIYPDPTTFKPERWLTDDPPSDKYFHPFSKGTRACLGLTLAYAELYLTIARVFRRYGSKEVQMHGDEGYLELYETTERNIEIMGDGFVPIYRTDCEGVRVLVKDY